METSARNRSIRYYTDPSQPYPMSPVNNQRYSRFRGTPINIDSNIIMPELLNTAKHNTYQTTNPNRYGQSAVSPPTNRDLNSLKSSNIYYKPGRVLRTDLGWDAIKQSEYIINNMSTDYSANARTLEKFQREAQENRKKRIHKHRQKNSNLPTLHEYTQQNRAITPQLTPYDYSPIKEYQSPEDEPVFVRNVGVNTNKSYEIDSLQKLVHLQEKYEKLKHKYRLKKRKKVERSIRQDDEGGSTVLCQLQSKLLGISEQLTSNNEALAQLMQDRQKSPIKNSSLLIEEEQEQKNSSQAQESRILPAINPSKYFQAEQSKRQKKGQGKGQKKQPRIIYTIPRGHTLAKSTDLQIR